ncbi:MAG: recombinase family protein [Deltaproteobacteria bacterium]|nr:recombinase family protein [Deltaproteobacteria bacterium]
MKLLPIHRVSTLGQAGDDREGLDRQRHSTRLVAETHRAKLLPAVEIENVSGSDLAATPEWQNQVQPAISDPDTHIASDSIDRILRAEDFNFEVFRDLLATKTRIFTPGKIHDLAIAEDAFMAGLLALVGGREKSEIKRRIQAGREAKRRRGEWPLKLSALPRGILYDPKTKAWSYDKTEADIITSVFHQFVVERRPLRAIGRTIGKPMQTVRGYLQSPIYKGLLVYDQKRGEKYPSKNGRQPDRKKIARAPHEIIEVRVFGGPDQLQQLVPDDEWAETQGLLLENSKTSLRRREAGKPQTWASGFLSSWYVIFGNDGLTGFVRLSLDDEPGTPHTIYANGGSVQFPHRYSCRCARTQEREKGEMQRCGLRNPRAAAVNATVDAFLTDLTSDHWFFDAVRAALASGQDTTADQRSILAQRLACQRSSENVRTCT